ncbi:hypothetical protein ABNF97_27575 [Plantactinospora sp. B6F1]|uniref:hypothetical protein n=1 Tax=Plantactinospora sp. B6F1 TaxID=3158971 RepID=UPI0032D8CF96
MVLLPTIMCYSVEGFLRPAEAAEICDEMDMHKAGLPQERVLAGGGNSIHTVKNLTVEQAVQVYEPKGRVEVLELPPRVLDILGEAVSRNMPNICRAYPEVRTVGPWFYVEYEPGQFITPHADQYKNKNAPEHPKIGGLSVQLNDGFTGGEFYVETCGSPDIWTEADGETRLIRRANDSSEEFRSIPRTRWTSTPAVGTAFMYGSQLVHGTEPVTSGRIRKVISWLVG